MKNYYRKQVIILVLVAIQSFVVSPLLTSSLLLAAQANNDSIVDVTAPQVIHNTPEGGFLGEPLEISALVTDNIQVEKVMLYFRVEGGNADYTEVAMLKGEGDNYSVSIQAEDKNSECFDYWIKALDVSGNTLLVGYKVMPKKVCLQDPAPVITHEMPTENLHKGNALSISANVTDNLKVDEVTLFFRSEGDVAYKSEKMKNKFDNTFIGLIPEHLTRADSVEYYFEAKDNKGNEAMLGSVATPYAALLGESLSNDIIASGPEDSSTLVPVTEKISKPWYKKPWVWIIGGGIVIAAAASGGGGGATASGGSIAGSPTSSIIISAPAP